MTSEERLDRIEHLTAGWIEQSKREHDENRRLWREMKERMEERDRKFDQRTEELREEMAGRDRRFDERTAALREEMAGRDRVADERIQKLVSAIGELIRGMKQSGGQAE